MTLGVDTSPEQSFRQALVAMVMIGRNRPHLYRPMFTTATGDMVAAVLAAGRPQDLFLTIMTGVVDVDGARGLRAF